MNFKVRYFLAGLTVLIFLCLGVLAWGANPLLGGLFWGLALMRLIWLTRDLYRLKGLRQAEEDLADIEGQLKRSKKHKDPHEQSL